jgi:hypothetical protein
MADPVLSALVTRRAELVAEAKVTDAKLAQLLTDIEHIDGAMRTFDAKHQSIKVRLERGRHVSLSRTVLGVLRQASGPLAVRDIALQVMEKRGKDQKDAKAVRATIDATRAVLLHQRKNGTLRSEQGPGQLVLWEVAH